MVWRRASMTEVTREHQRRRCVGRRLGHVTSAQYGRPVTTLGLRRIGTLFPVAVWAVWRLGHIAALVAFGGDPVDDSFRFDGAWMRSVLDGGYVLSDESYTVQQNVAFFPGLPYLTRPFAEVLGVDVGALVVANLAALATFCAVFAAVRAVSEEAVARRAVIALALWPGSIALWAFMSEGVFLAASGAAVWADSRRRPGLATFLAWCAGTFRAVGFMVGPALAVARVVRTRRVDGVAWAYAISGAASLATVSLLQHLAVGDGLAFSRSQEAWNRSVTFPGRGLVRAAREVVDELPHLRLELTMNLVSVAVVAAALVLATRHFGFRGAQGGALAVGWFAFVIPLCSDLVASQVRYMMGAWAATLVLALGVVRLRALWLIAATVGFVGTLFLLQRWANGDFVA